MQKKNIKEWIDLLTGSTPGQNVELPVLSGSMHPYLPSGTTALVRTIVPEETKNLHPGAIIVYRTKLKLTAHRMIYKFPFNKMIYEKGDMNRFGSFVPMHSVVGVVYARKDNDNNICDFFTKDQIRIAKKEAYKGIFEVFVNAVLILPRRVKNVLAKK